MGECCSCNADSKFDTAIYAHLDDTEIDDSLDDIYYHVHSSDKLNHAKQIEQKLDVGSRDSYYENGRKRISPSHTEYTGIIAQIVTEFEHEGESKLFLTSGCIYIMKDIKKVFVITLASTFIHSYEVNSCAQFEYAKRSTIFLARDGETEYWAKAPLSDYKFHPSYLKYPGLHGGFDIAVASFDISKSKSFIKNLDTFKNMLAKITPSLITSLKVKSTETLYITGYPGETSGCMYQIKGQVYDMISIDDDATKLIILKDLKATGGLNGAPVLKIDEDKTELIGLYVGYDETCSTHVVAAIAQNINSWILDLLKERLLVEDLEIKLLPSIKYKAKNKNKVESIKEEQGNPVTGVVNDNNGDLIDGDWVLLDSKGSC